MFSKTNEHTVRLIVSSYGHALMDINNIRTTAKPLLHADEQKNHRIKIALFFLPMALFINTDE